MSTSSHNRITTSYPHCSFPSDILEHLSTTQASIVIIRNLCLQLIQLGQLRRRRPLSFLLPRSILIHDTRSFPSSSTKLTKPAPTLLLDQTRPTTQKAARTIRPSNPRQILVRSVMIRAIRIIRIEGLPRQEASDAAWSCRRCRTQGRILDRRRRSAAAIIDSIRSAGCWLCSIAIDGRRRGVSGLDLGGRRRRFLFDGRVRRWRNIGSFCQGKGDRRESGEGEAPIGPAVCRHYLSWLIPAGVLVCQM